MNRELEISRVFRGAVSRLTARQVAGWLPRRRQEAHKGEAGHVLILAGSRGMSGAAALCSRGALRGGAGLVTVGCPASQQPIIAVQVAEALTGALPETSQGAIARSAGSVVVMMARDRQVRALVIGPGLSTHPDAAKVVEHLLHALPQPVVLDADGLNAWASRRSLAARDRLLRNRQGATIITPHPGELARWVGATPGEIQRDRVGWALRVSQQAEVICVLKGYQTVVARDRTVVVNPTGNPGMATGGSGDVLAGLMGALLGQGLDPWRTACVGVYLHGLAGDLAAQAHGPIGFLAGDIADAIPLAMQRLGRVMSVGRSHV